MAGDELAPIVRALGWGVDSSAKLAGSASGAAVAGDAWPVRVVARGEAPAYG